MRPRPRHLRQRPPHRRRRLPHPQPQRSPRPHRRRPTPRGRSRPDRGDHGGVRVRHPVPAVRERGVRGHHLPRGQGADPARRAEPARTGRRRHRHRQDQDPPAHGRAAVGPGRPGLPRRHQGRPRPAWPAAGEPNAEDRRERCASIGHAWEPQGYPVEFLSLGGMGHGRPDPGDDHLVRPGAAVEGAGAQRRPRSPQPRPGLPLRRPARPAAARPQGPARGHLSTSLATRARPTSRSSAACPRRPPG